MVCLVSQSWWPKVVARKWLNIQSGADEFHSDYVRGKNLVIYRFFKKFRSYISVSDINRVLPMNEISDKSERRKSCSDDDYYVFVREDFSGNLLLRNDTVLFLLGTWKRIELGVDTNL